MKRIIVEVTERDKLNFESKLEQNGKNMAETIRAFVRAYGSGKVQIITEDRIEILSETNQEK